MSTSNPIFANVETHIAELKAKNDYLLAALVAARNKYANLAAAGASAVHDAQVANDADTSLVTILHAATDNVVAKAQEQLSTLTPDNTAVEAQKEHIAALQAELEDAKAQLTLATSAPSTPAA